MAQEHTASGVQCEGHGAMTRGAGQTPLVHYTGWLEGGHRFDCSGERNQPLRCPVGCGCVIRGWDAGIVGMRVGGSRRLTVPPHLGCGARGAGDAIPPHVTLTFDIELLELSP